MIKARTDGEVRAYEQGYLQAVLDVQKHGLTFAVDAARLMTDVINSRQEEKRSICHE